MANYIPAKFSAMEQEIVVLKAVWDMIDEMVNFEIFERLPSTQDTSLMFCTRTHQRFFNIQLVDFLSRPDNGVFDLPRASKPVSETDKSYLYCLQTICSNPHFGARAIDALKTPLSKFRDWLEAVCRIEKVWFPSIQTEATVSVRRISFIKICGNISKHNFTRLDRNARDIKAILLANGIEISDTDAYLVLPEFYQWFHDNVFNYHGSAIAEFLNNIRWGIYEYLRAEFQRSFTREPDHEFKYHFKYPEQCSHPFAKEVYWNLMNDVRGTPYMPKFEVTRYLKMRY